MSERELLTNFAQAKQKYDQLNLELSVAEAELEFHKQALLVHLNNVKAKKTATYSGIGSATAWKPRVKRSYYPRDLESEFFDFVRDCDCESIIKYQIHPMSLNAFVQSRLELLKEIPPYVFVESYQTVRWNKERPKFSVPKQK